MTKSTASAAAAETPAEVADPAVAAWTATLERGETYVYKSRFFRKGVPFNVTEETKAYLEENAYDDVTVGEGDEVELDRRPKFKFARIRNRG